jgi:hypothetical protein
MTDLDGELPPEVAEISNGLKNRIIGAYEVVGKAFKPGLDSIILTLTPGQCATILSSLNSGFKNSFNEYIPGSMPDDTENGLTRDQAIEIVSKMHGNASTGVSKEFHRKWCGEWVDMFVKLGILKLVEKSNG